jgi:hypothetical protein
LLGDKATPIIEGKKKPRKEGLANSDIIENRI